MLLGRNGEVTREAAVDFSLIEDIEVVRESRGCYIE